MDIEIKRQLVHACGIFIAFIVYFFDRLTGSVLILSMLIFAIIISEYRKRRLKLRSLIGIKILNKIEDFMENQFKNHERVDEIPMNGIITFILGAFLASILFSKEIAIASIIVLALGDSISTLVGKFYGKHKLPINPNKSWEGSLAFFFMSFFILTSFVTFLEAFMISMLVTVVEMIPRIDDNLSIPLAIGILMSLA
jgi:dolichol kinase